MTELAKLLEELNDANPATCRELFERDEALLLKRRIEELETSLASHRMLRLARIVKAVHLLEIEAPFHPQLSGPSWVVRGRLLAGGDGTLGGQICVTGSGRTLPFAIDSFVEEADRVLPGWSEDP